MTDDNFDPWSTPPKDKKKKPAGSTPPGGNGPQRGREPEPDLEEALKNIGRQFKGFMGDNDGNNKKTWLYIIYGLIAFWLVTSSVFMLSAGEKSVILRFGEYHRTVSEGLNFKLPYPIEKKFTRSVSKVNQFDVGAEQENLMVTADENIADVKYTVLWRINNLQSFVFNLSEQEQTVRAAAESAMREVIGNTKLSVALGEGAGRTLIAQESQDILQAMLNNYKAGVEVVGIQLQKIDVPPQVVEAQIAVQNAKTEQEKVKNQAEAYRNELLPQARGEAERMVQEAEGYKQATIAKASGDAERFIKVYDEYKNARDVTRKRIYLETMQEIMKGMDKIIMDDSGKTVPYLPLNNAGKVETGGKQ